MTGNMVIVGMVSAIILAAVGIRIAGGEPWRGAVLAVAFILGGLAASSLSPSLILAFIAGAVVASIVAGAMGIPAKQSANAMLGCVIGHLIPLFLV